MLVPAHQNYVRISCMAKVFRNKTILQILDHYRDFWSLSYAAGVLGWDLKTYMPKGGATPRGVALGRISTIQQRLFLSKDFVSLVHQASVEKNLTDAEKGVVRVLLHQLRFFEKIPPKFLEDFSLLTSEASVVWRNAKEKEDYKLFEPYLKRIFDSNRKMAEYLGYKDSPYDALLDLFEEGLTVGDVEPFFDSIRKPLKTLLSQIVKSDKYNNSHFLEEQAYNKGKLERLNLKILKLLFEDSSRLRLDVSSHPFTTSFSRSDTRITTWYHRNDFARSLLAVIHEFGHALYDLQADPGLEMTPIQGGTSLVIHESQSRFWENFVGRSDEFLLGYLIDFKGLSKPIGRYIDVEKIKGLRMYFNKVSPGALRVEADEVTYHFHIMLRYEIEKEIMEGRLKIKDLREIWNTKMKNYLGINPRKDSEGVLQDIHWSMGNVGYFPTYSLGTFLGAQWEQQIKSSKLKINNYEEIKKWLRLHIHQYGSTYTMSDLLKKNKMKFDPEVNLRYLREKYGKIYGF